MAGNYPDVPAPMMAWDRDGSSLLLLSVAQGTATELSETVRRNLNDETTSRYELNKNPDGTKGFAIIFPELRDVSAWQVSWDTTATAWSPSEAQVSTNSTNGIDGSWTTVKSAWSEFPVSREGYREDFDTPDPVASAVKAIRFLWTNNPSGTVTADLWSIRLYGAPAAGAAPNRLRFWHPTLDQEVGAAHFDWGDLPRNADVTKDFRLHNPSGQTATAVTLTTEALTDTTPANTSQHAYSIAAGPYTTSLNIGDISPGTTSGIITVRRQVPANAALGLWWARIVATASSWV